MAIEQRRTEDSSATGGLADDWRRIQAEVRSVGASVGSISDELRVLVSREQDLARAEMADNVAAVRGASIWTVAAAFAGVAVVVFAGLAMMFGLATVIELWAAALATALAFSLIAGLLGMLAMRRAREFSLLPKHTLRSVQEDVTWARKQFKRNAAS